MKIHTFTSIIFFLLACLEISNAQTKGTRLDGVIAIVGKNIVQLSDVEAQYHQSIMHGEKSGQELKCEIFEEILLQNLLLNQAQVDSIIVPDNEVENEMERRLRFFIAQIGSRDALEEFYNKSILEIKAEFRDIIKEQLLVQKMQQQITTDVKVTPSEVRQYFHSLTIEEIPDIELTFQLAHLIIMPEVSEAEREEAKNEITKLRDRTLKGDDFGTLAVLFSEDPVSSKKRGELDFFDRGEMFPEFEAAAFKLRTPGEISPIIETRAGFHILQLIERRGELINVRHILIKLTPGPESVLAARNKIDSLHNLISLGQITFEEAVALYSTEKNKKKNGQMINPITLDNTFLASQMDAPLLFAVKNTDVGSVTEVISYKDDENRSGFRIVKVVKKTPPHKANLQDSYPYIQQLALENKKREALNTWIIDKKKQTYIKVFEPYNKCGFEFDW